MMTGHSVFYIAVPDRAESNAMVLIDKFTTPLNRQVEKSFPWGCRDVRPQR